MVLVCVVLMLNLNGAHYLIANIPFYLMQIFRGLAYIHTVPGVCHRDIKPQNILVCLFLLTKHIMFSHCCS